MPQSGGLQFFIKIDEASKARQRKLGDAVQTSTGVWASGTEMWVSVALSEADVHWRQFLNDLIRRGLRGVKLIISDDHSGLKAARRAALPSVPWQRCQFHLQQNAHSYVPRVNLRALEASHLRPDEAILR